MSICEKTKQCCNDTLALQRRTGIVKTKSCVWYKVDWKQDFEIFYSIESIQLSVGSFFRVMDAKHSIFVECRKFYQQFNFLVCQGERDSTPIATSLSENKDHIQIIMAERFTDELRTKAGDQWNRVIHHKFTKELAAGTIDKQTVLKRYLIQDHRFLDSFVVLLASIVANVPTLKDRIPGCQFLA